MQIGSVGSRCNLGKIKWSPELKEWHQGWREMGVLEKYLGSAFYPVVLSGGKKGF